jgi:uncharacterized Fe-S cluster-containing radical SAM superfamily protein
MTIDTEDMSARLRAKSVDTTRRKILITRLTGTAQEPDLSEPATCGGHGRVRHFNRATSDHWPDNPLPIDPACAALGLPHTDAINALVFQNASCNWRCWYCYVPFPLLAGDERSASWLTAGELVDGYLALGDDRPPMLDLSGGQPDLVPEWTLWIVRAMRERCLDGQVYLWIDDNLSNDYFWTKLTDAERAEIHTFPTFGRVGCFKGYDDASFAFNTGAAAELFDRQFRLMARHIADGDDCYGYVTFTAPTDVDPSVAVARFVDRLQGVHELLPLRVVPLEIEVWGPVEGRLGDRHQVALRHQHEVVAAWMRELDDRFSAQLRGLRINQIPLR